MIECHLEAAATAAVVNSLVVDLAAQQPPSAFEAPDPYGVPLRGITTPICVTAASQTEVAAYCALRNARTNLGRVEFQPNPEGHFVLGHSWAGANADDADMALIMSTSPVFLNDIRAELGLDTVAADGGHFPHMHTSEVDETIAEALGSFGLQHDTDTAGTEESKWFLFEDPVVVLVNNYGGRIVEFHGFLYNGLPATPEMAAEIGALNMANQLLGVSFCADTTGEELGVFVRSYCMGRRIRPSTLEWALSMTATYGAAAIDNRGFGDAGFRHYFATLTDEHPELRLGEE